MEKMNTTLISGVLSDALSKHSEENRDLLNDFLSKSIEVNNNKFEEINTKMEALMKTKTKMIYRPDFDVAGEKAILGSLLKRGMRT